MPAGQNFNPPPPLQLIPIRNFAPTHSPPPPTLTSPKIRGIQLKGGALLSRMRQRRREDYSLLHKNSRNLYPSPDLSPCQLPLCTFPHLQKSILTYILLYWKNFMTFFSKSFVIYSLKICSLNYTYCNMHCIYKFVAK